MAGKIIADTLEHSTAGSVDTQYVVNGSGKMWATVNHSTSTIKDSFNTASITDHSAGNLTNTATNALDNANYAISGTNIGDTQTSFALNVASRGNANATTSYQYRTYNTVNDSLYDATSVSTVVHGDLA